MTERAIGPSDAEELALRRLILGPADDESVEIVLGRVVPRLTAFLRGRFPDLGPEDAGDLAREALTIAMERRDVFDPDRDTRVTSWLHGIAKLRAVDLFRKRGADGRLADGSDLDDDDARADRRDRVAIQRATAERYPTRPLDPALERAIRQAIADLPEQQRRAAEAHYLDGRAPRDVDEQFGWRPNTANVYLSHARRAMRSRLADVAEPFMLARGRFLTRASAGGHGPVALACPTRRHGRAIRATAPSFGAIGADAIGLALVA